MAKEVGNKTKSCSNQAILSNNSRQTKIKNKAQTKNDSGLDGAWHDEGILAPIPPERG